MCKVHTCDPLYIVWEIQVISTPDLLLKEKTLFLACNLTWIPLCSRFHVCVWVKFLDSQGLCGIHDSFFCDTKDPCQPRIMMSWTYPSLSKLPLIPQLASCPLWGKDKVIIQIISQLSTFPLLPVRIYTCLSRLPYDIVKKTIYLNTGWTHSGHEIIQ